jgi:biotin carboxyl carrier protein
VLTESRLGQPPTQPPAGLGLQAPPQAPQRRPLWRRPRVLLGILGLLLLFGIAAAAVNSRSAAPAVVTAPASTALIAHGQIMPARQARVGTQAGGVVQQLDARLGADVAAQAPLATVAGPAGSEIVTAPFGGSVSNVLVHAGDTLAPGATVAVVADLHTLQVETADVDEFLVGHVRVGQRVEVTVDALDNRVLTGTITNIALLPQTAASGSQAYPVIVSLGSLPPEVHAGMSVRLTLPD